MEGPFTKWRTITYLSMFIGWGLYMLVRKTLPSSMQSLIQHKGFSKDDVGLIASCFAFSYGISKLVFSFVSDHVSPGKLFVSGLLLNGICCVVFPVSTGVTMACIVWSTAGIVQGCGWPPLVILLKKWYSPSQIGTWWSVLSGAGNIAAGSSPLLILYITRLFDWTMSYYLIGLTTFTLGCVSFFTIRDSPKDAGVSSSHSGQTQNGELKKAKSDGRWWTVFLCFDLWVVALLYTGVSVVKDGVMNWMILFLVEVGNKPEAMAAASIGMYQIGGLAGNLTIGYLSDVLIVKKANKCPRAPVLLGLTVFLLAAVHTYRTSVGANTPEVWLSVVIFTVGFLADGVIAIAGLCAMEVVPSHMAGGAHGVACAISQLGCVLAGWPFAYVMNQYGWNMAYWLVELCSVAMVFGGLYLFYVMTRSLEQRKKQHID